MTETHATDSPTAPLFPPGRYGRRRSGRRRRPWLVGLLAALLVGVLVLVSAQLYDRYGDPNYTAEVITYTEITDSQVLVDFRVTVPPGGSAICVLRARSRDGAEVAREEVAVRAEPGERHPAVRHLLATTARPMIGEVVRCRPAD
nr:DUF4307 domain-containing protein [Micromonospora sp. DSM 115978]